jgi:DNA-binding LytR/AlgR family response regulator
MSTLKEIPTLETVHLAHPEECVEARSGLSSIRTVPNVWNEAGKHLHQTLFIKDGKCFSRLPLKEVLYIEADLNYVEVNTTSRRHVVRISLCEFVEQLPSTIFQRVNRSAAVNLLHLDAIEGNQLHIGPHRVRLGRAHRTELLARLRIIMGR